MNNVIMRKVNVTSAYQPLTAVKTVVSVTISAPPTNAQPVVFRGDDGSEVSWLPGEWHDFKSIDLSAVLVKGTPGDVVTVIGGTW